MCGLRPGELAGLRWPFVDIDSDEPTIDVAERANEVRHKYVARPSQRRPGLDDGSASTPCSLRRWSATGRT